MNQLPPLLDRLTPLCTLDLIYDHVDVYWYHPAFSQSRYPPGQKVSEACTLICLLVAEKVGQLDLDIRTIEKSLEFNIVLAEAMIQGNSIHAAIMDRKLIRHPYLTTEEALKFGGKILSNLKEWKFQVFNEDIRVGLHKNIAMFLCEWYKKPKSRNLFMLLITSGRTILLIFQEHTRKVTLIDSHGHATATNPNRGLVVAQTDLRKLEHLCHWFVHWILLDCFQARPGEYELAFLYRHGFEGNRQEVDSMNPNPKTLRILNNCHSCRKI